MWRKKTGRERKKVYVSNKIVEARAATHEVQRLSEVLTDLLWTVWGVKMKEWDEAKSEPAQHLGSSSKNPIQALHS